MWLTYQSAVLSQALLLLTSADNYVNVVDESINLKHSKILSRFEFENVAKILFKGQFLARNFPSFTVLSKLTDRT